MRSRIVLFLLISTLFLATSCYPSAPPPVEGHPDWPAPAADASSADAQAASLASADLAWLHAPVEDADLDCETTGSCEPGAAGGVPRPPNWALGVAGIFLIRWATRRHNRIGR